MNQARIPVILDTDIGGDIDDTWALAMLLKHPALETKLVVGDTGDPAYRAALIAKFLDRAGRTDVPVGIGPDEGRALPKRQTGWVGDYTAADYPGTVHEDGIQAIIDTIRQSPTPVTIVCIGPVPNIELVLQRAPDVVQNARFVGMHGSIRLGHNNNPVPVAETNVVRNPQSLARVLEAPWLAKTITPLDTCGTVRLGGDNYQRLFEHMDDPILAALFENYRCWASVHEAVRINPNERSSVLFDTVAVHLAASHEFLNVEPMGVRVTDDGFTVLDDDAPSVDVAISWQDQMAFHRHLVDLLVQ
jgi:inosine-uridine nucleoside N-ribohydrolase